MMRHRITVVVVPAGPRVGIVTDSEALEHCAAVHLPGHVRGGW